MVAWPFQRKADGLALKAWNFIRRGGFKKSQHLVLRFWEVHSSVINRRQTVPAIPNLIVNFDLHIAVNRDMKDGLSARSLELQTYSFSSHNALVPDRRPVADPTLFVNGRNWRKMNPQRIKNFQYLYRPIIRQAAGYLVTYPVSFAQLSALEGKPSMVVAATRYEAPYSLSEQRWLALNDLLRAGIEDGWLSLVANNRGDADYIEAFAGFKVPILPSLCSYTGARWQGDTSGERLLMCNDTRLLDTIEEDTNFRFQRLRRTNQPYSYTAWERCSEIFVIPQNISTMTLFELATAGVPVAVPSANWISKLRESNYRVLDQLTFVPHRELALLSNSPIKADWETDEGFLDWWMQRADFYNVDLMPNVRVCDSIEQLMNEHRSSLSSEFSAQTMERNDRLKNDRDQAILAAFGTLVLA